MNTSEKHKSWLGLEAPRYTSYPSAHHFAEFADGNIPESWLEAVESDTGVSVYVHIPFCQELCYFCGCHTKITKHYEPLAKYVLVLLKEIAALGQRVTGKGVLTNIHFGGGSPSMLNADDLQKIVSAIFAAFPQKKLEEVAIELDPRTTTPENIEIYKKVGFNRISLGIQDFDPTVQVAINRVQPYELVVEVMKNLRAAGLERINCDLIYGLPHQTKERFLDSLKKTLALNPSRIALFSYAHVPQVKKHQRLILEEWLPNEEQKLELYMAGCELLQKGGYEFIGIDHFAKPDDPMAIALHNGTLRRNFQGYVTDNTDILLGVGVSSISQFPGGYAQNNSRIVEYREAVEAGKLPIARGLAFKGDDVIRKKVIDDIMCFMGVDLPAICARFNLAADYFAKEIERLSQEDYREVVAIENGNVRLTIPYRMAARAVASVFDSYHRAAAGRYSKVA